MGACISLWYRRKTHTVAMIGLQGVGKTTILYKMKKKGLLPDSPLEIGYNLEIVSYSESTFAVWDMNVGGTHSGTRSLMQTFAAGTKAIIFVVDSTNTERIADAKEQLDQLLSIKELNNTPLLIFANKQDLPRALSTSQLIDKLGLFALHNRKWNIQASSATYGDGLYEGFEWVHTTLRGRR
ncbi:ADP-ribosylation factor [Serendipita indica DSM 11827]|nr:ADP-ribosylation factor [Serendipita indica DSM 11827]